MLDMEKVIKLEHVADCRHCGQLLPIGTLVLRDRHYKVFCDRRCMTLGVVDKVSVLA